jgi:hypothetical protein
MNYNFNVEIKNLLGESILDEKNNPATAGKLLAGSLVNQAKGNSIKFYNWALKMYNCEDVNLDKSDVKVLTEYVESNEQLTVLVKAQILEVLDQKEN